MYDQGDLKAIARRQFEEIMPALDVAALEQVVAEDVIDHGRRPDEPPGREGAKQTMFWLASVFSDERWEIHHVIGDGDLVAVHCTLHGRHTGDLMGIPPTNREVAVDYVHIFRFEDSKVVEYWSVRDDLSLMRQLGVIPERPSQPVGAAA
jgi:predicted ester cyclase